MVKLLSVTFVASIFLAAVAFILQDGWLFFASRWMSLGCALTFFSAFFVGLIPSRALGLESSEDDGHGGVIGDREHVLAARSRNFTQWQIKYDHSPKT